MKIKGSNTVIVDFTLVQNGIDETENFIRESIIGKEGDVTIVKNVMKCVGKASNFINRCGEFEALKPSDNDYMIVNGKKFSKIGLFQTMECIDQVKK